MWCHFHFQSHFWSPSKCVSLVTVWKNSLRCNLKTGVHEERCRWDSWELAILPSGNCLNSNIFKWHNSVPRSFVAWKTVECTTSATSEPSSQSSYRHNFNTGSPFSCCSTSTTPSLHFQMDHCDLLLITSSLHIHPLLTSEWGLITL